MSFQTRLPALLAALLLTVACGDGALPLAPEMSAASPAATQSGPLLRTNAVEYDVIAGSAGTTAEYADGAAAYSNGEAASAQVPSESGASDAPVREEDIADAPLPYSWLAYPPLLSGYMLSSGRKAPEQ